jgi:lipid-A-disaccharide synthase
MLVIFPFEEAWYRERGVLAEYVGHPLVDALIGIERNLTVPKEKPVIALLPGSRKSEVKRHLRELFLAASFLGPAYRYVIPVASTLDKRWLELAFYDTDPNYFSEKTDEIEWAEPPAVEFVDSAPKALRHARAAVVASGTATVETALIGTPMVVVYRLSGLTWKLGRRLVKLDHFAMPNLIAGRRIVPELIQHDFTAENVVAELRKIIPDGPDRQRMIADLAEVRARLRPTGTPPAQRAAQVVLEVAEKGQK